MRATHVIALGILVVGAAMLYFGDPRGFLVILASPTTYLAWLVLNVLLSHPPSMDSLDHVCGGSTCTYSGCPHRAESDPYRSDNPTTGTANDTAEGDVSQLL